ncbi:ph-response sensor protein [Myotisia sp. PD_48]|nr:ph-response sensor protein [Myotisia sp. PD_48]
MAFDPLANDPLSLPTRSRSILSKFTGRFSNRNRNISEFYVQPDDPWKTYYPGDVVKGAVVLTVVKPLRITHLVVCLHGFAKVFKNPVGPGEHAEDSGFLGPGRGRRDGEYLGNGFASLFEDEVVLCGDGRLKEGIYKFRFELCFPPYNLPSSINFERGTISYMITSTLTRPTTISPAISCDKRLILLERIDIAPLLPPKPRVISLEPILKKPNTRSSKTKSTSDDCIPGGAVTSSPDPSSQHSGCQPPLSPVPSEQSNSSCISNSTQSFQVISEANSTRGENTITATTKLLRAGGLPGDALPLKISISHTKPIRSPNGIIVTFYRQGRIDMYPAIPIGTTAKGKKPVYEDYYPKSRTGLGGLTFGATRSCSVFRKDMSQTFCPLMVDPNTMTADIKASIRIPEDCFPTIARVPGAMISFRYYVEVVMDIRGKLAGQDRFLQRLSVLNSSSNHHYHSNNPLPAAPDASRNLPPTVSGFSGNILDTDQVRRDKSLIVCVFEVVIGSKDSGRGQSQNQNEERRSDQHDQFDAASSSEQAPDQPPSHDGTREQPQQTALPHLRFVEPRNSLRDDYLSEEQDTWHSRPPDRHPLDHPQFVPPIQPEEAVDEKTRLRRAEESLLPSAPPSSNHLEASSSTAPSAPILSEYDDALFFEHPSPIYTPAIYPHTFEHFPSAPSAPSTETITPLPALESVLINQPQDPLYHTSSSPDSSTILTDDKQELERRHLLAQASAPGDSNYSQANPSSPALNMHEHDYDFHNQIHPTAPTVNEDEITGVQAPKEESLPRYER